MDLTPYNLGNTVSKLAIPLPRTETFKNSFSYSGAVLWNSLPDHLGQASSLTTFRSSIRFEFVAIISQSKVVFFTRRPCKAESFLFHDWC